MSTTHLYVGLALLSTFYIILRRFQSKGGKDDSSPSKIRNGNKSTPTSTKVTANDVIQPLVDFNFWAEEPIKYRPYKTSGHVTMGIQPKSRNDWVHIDSNYLDRIKQRERLIQQHPKATIAADPIASTAIEELYSEVMINFLPRRYPSMFKTVGQTVCNEVTGSTYPLSASGLTPEEMLQVLGVHVEDDFFLMCPDEFDGEFYLRGCVGCFPNGFLGPAHMGQSVREIHQPVPGYDERLGNGVDRYFQRMKAGSFIGRMNWSLQVDGPELFRTDGLNYYPSSEHSFEEKVDPDLGQCFLRVEHQTLTCLPRSKAIVFCVHSYMTPLEQIRQEGDGPKLAAAIESMPEKLGLYKMRQFWGEKVLPWLKEGPTAEI